MIIIYAYKTVHNNYEYAKYEKYVRRERKKKSKTK